MKIRTLLVAVLFTPALAWSQAFPTKPVTIVVPYPPGGLIDLVARIIQPGMQAELGQSVVIENKSGAGGNVGADAVAHAAPDGHTLLLANPSLAISPSIYPKLSYRPIEDFAYIGRYGAVPNILVVHPSLPANNAKEFIDYVRKNPGKLNYGSPGYGTSPQLSSELFKQMTNTFIVHIPFRGAGPAIAALMANEIQLMIDNLPPQVPLIKAGKVRPLAVTSLKRVPILPDVPTMDEIGLKGYEVQSFFGLAARAGTPQPVVMRLNEALNKVTRDPKVKESLESRGSTVVQGTPEEFVQFIKAETAKFAPVVKRANITPE